MSHQKQNRLNRQQKHPANRRAPPEKDSRERSSVPFAAGLPAGTLFLHRFPFIAVGTDIPKQHPPFLKNPKAFTQARGQTAAEDFSPAIENALLFHRPNHCIFV